MKTLLRALLVVLLIASPAFADVVFQKASFNGFVGIGGATPDEQGGVKLTTTATGGYTIVGKVGSKGFSTKGTFDASGHVDKDIEIKVFGFTVAKIHLTLQLAVDGESIDGLVTVSGKTYNFTLYRAFYSKDTPATIAGTFTALLPSPGGAFPGGTGYASITISPTGVAKVKGRLADGSVISTGGSLSKGDIFPIFNILYAKRGALGGFVDFSSNDVGTGSLFWVRLDAATPDVLNPSSWSGNITINVQRYIKPDVGTSVIPGVTNGNIFFSFNGGNVDGGALPLGASLSSNNKITVAAPNTNKLAAAVNLNTGIVTGHVKLPLGGVLTTTIFRGAVRQSAASPEAEGYFLGGDLSGKFTITP